MTSVRMALLSVVLCMLLLSTFGSAQQTQPSGAGTVFACGGAGYDLSSIHDLSIVSGPYTWTLNPCLPVTTYTGCTNSTFCQGTTALAYYNPLVDVVEWSTITGGIMSHSINGATDACSFGTFVRTGTVQYLCNQTATSAFISFVEEVQQCQYMAIVQTSLVCAAPLTGASTQVGIPFSSTVCGGGLFNLSSLDSTDFTYSIGGGNYAWRPCTPVSFNSARGGCPAGTSFCQTSSNASLSAGSGLAQTYTLQSNGLIIQSQDGDICGGDSSHFGWPREASVVLQCSATATTPVVVAQYEGVAGLSSYELGDSAEYCHYTTIIQTAAVCARLSPVPTPPVQPVFGCGGAGYDFTAISSVDLLYNPPTGSKWFFNPCRPLTTGPCAGKGASLCQTAINSYSYVAAYANPAVAPVMWTTTTFDYQPAVQSFSAYGDAGCGPYGVRQATVVYVCSPNQLSPLSVLDSVFENTTCSYTAVVNTSLACPGNQLVVASPATVGLPFTTSQCGGGLYNLATLDSADFAFASNGSSSQMNYWRPCSAATNCPAGSSFCQQVTSTTQVSLAAVQSATATKSYTLQSNGLVIQAYDGTYCSGTSGALRATTTQLVCGQSATPQLISFTDDWNGIPGFLNPSQTTCHYQLILATSAVCSRATAPALGSSSSSSSAAARVASSSSSGAGGGGGVLPPPIGGAGSSAGSSSSSAVSARSMSSSSSVPAATSAMGASSSSAAVVGRISSSSSAAAVVPSSSAAIQVSSSSSPSAPFFPVLIASSSTAAPSSSSSSLVPRSASVSSSSSSSGAGYVPPKPSTPSSSSSSVPSTPVSSSSSSSSSTGLGAPITPANSASAAAVSAGVTALALLAASLTLLL